MNRPTPPFRRGFRQREPQQRINQRIKARDVRVIGPDGNQLGVMPTQDAIALARRHGLDLVEVASNAEPPVCRIIDFGKYRYELSKKEKEAKKHQHANKVKEVQLSPNIDPHDFTTKFNRAVDFLCADMKVKVCLRYRGRDLRRKEIGFIVIRKFIEEIAIFGVTQDTPKLVGRAINIMLSPLPRNKRAKNPRGENVVLHEDDDEDHDEHDHDDEDDEHDTQESGPEDSKPVDQPVQEPDKKGKKRKISTNAAKDDFHHNPFAELEGL